MAGWGKVGNSLRNHNLHQPRKNILLVTLTYISQESLEEEAVHWFDYGAGVRPDVDYRVFLSVGGGVEVVSEHFFCISIHTSNVVVCLGHVFVEGVIATRNLK
jgi:hypothetical protein